jgi:hypothetical protein
MVSAFDFTEKRQFATKIDRNSIVLGRRAQIIDRLHMMILCKSFYRLKIKFWLKYKGDSFWFYRKM